MKCDQCDACMIHGVLCHETGCPNSRKVWNAGRVSICGRLRAPRCQPTASERRTPTRVHRSARERTSGHNQGARTDDNMRLTPRQTFILVIVALCLVAYVAYVTGRQAASLLSYDAGRAAAVLELSQP